MFTAQCFDIQEMGLDKETRHFFISDFGERGNDCWHEYFPDDYEDDYVGIIHIQKMREALIKDGWDQKSIIMLKVWW